MASDYPKRPSHFAHRFVRLLTKSCAAQTIGPEACWMLCIIAHQEDVLRYRRPPTYYNGQLMPLVGFESDGRLIRARLRAIEDGWLHYEAGGKRKPGVYWVLIPDHAADLPDTPTEAGEDSTCEMHVQNGNANVAQTERKRSANVAQTERKRSANGNLPTLYPNSLYPSPIPNKYSDDFCRFWDVFPAGRKTAKGKAAEAWSKAVKLADPEIIIAAAAEYAASPLGQSDYVKGPAPWLNGRCWEDDRAAWQRSSDTRTAKQREDDEIEAKFQAQMAEIRQREQEAKANGQQRV